MFRWRTDVYKFMGVNWKFALQLLTLLSVFWQATAHHCLFESEISITDHCNTTQLAPGVLQQDCQNVPSLGNLFFFFQISLHCVHVFTGACVCMFVCGCVCLLLRDNSSPPVLFTGFGNRTAQGSLQSNIIV